MDRLPSQLSGYLGIVDSIPSVMTGAILDELDKLFRFTEDVDNQPNYFDIGFFVVAADIVDLSRSAFVQYPIDG